MAFDLIMTVWWFSASQGVSLLVCIGCYPCLLVNPRRQGLFVL